MQDDLDLADWRRRVGDLYRIRGEDALGRFRSGKDELFRTHPQSPIPEAEMVGSTGWPGLRYFPTDPAYRVGARLEAAGDGDAVIEIDTGGEDGVVRYRRAGVLRFRLGGEESGLTVFKQLGYGGGLFLPFRDATCGAETYGGGRYLFDTVKNTDGLCLELTAGSLEAVIDFNYAFNPSCAYNPRWACPLAPRENHLSVPIRAGELAYLWSPPALRS